MVGGEGREAGGGWEEVGCEAGGSWEEVGCVRESVREGWEGAGGGREELVDVRCWVLCNSLGGCTRWLCGDHQWVQVVR